ncbi:MAG: phosphoglycerate dehydrogenase-like enzyme [Alphaproteobacteria bacterium]|jgi:phosphoglycerate dehydrogenase-like enzyme
MKNLVIISRDWEVYKARFEKNKHLQTHFHLHSASQLPSKESLAVAEVIIGEPDFTSLYVKSCPNLMWLQSTWAGNNKLQGVDKQDYMLTGVKGVFGLQMVEYVLSYLLYFTRRIEDFNQVKSNKEWSQLPCKTLSEYSIGIMGLGSIGKEVANRLAEFGMKINGLSRGKKQTPKVNEYTYDELGSFLENCDFVLNLLPETAATKGFCNKAFFAQMKPGSVFINAGRGSVIDAPNSVIHAIETTMLKAAVLDVYEQEPLPATHPYYNTPNLYLSCHTAAISDPQKVFDVFEQNATNYISGEALLYKHDFAAGY